VIHRVQALLICWSVWLIVAVVIGSPLCTRYRSRCCGCAHAALGGVFVGDVQTDRLDQGTPGSRSTCLDPRAAPRICRGRPRHDAHRRLLGTVDIYFALLELLAMIWAAKALRQNDLSARTLIDLHVAPSCATGSIRRRERSRHPQAAATRWRSCPIGGLRRSLLITDVYRVLKPVAGILAQRRPKAPHLR
jgi:hypothetical protein